MSADERSVGLKRAFNHTPSAPDSVRVWPRYPKYRDSGIEWLGRVPVEWQTRRLKHVALVRLSGIDKHVEKEEQPVRLCNYTDVYNRSIITDDIEFMEGSASSAEIARFTLRRGDVLITKDSETWNDIAVPAFVSQDLDGVVCGYHLALVRPHPASLDGLFLSYAFSATAVASQFHIQATGITRYGLSQDDITTAILPLPPLPEQRAIAAFLDRETARIDALIAKKQRLIELLQEKRTALITLAVTRSLDRDVPMKASSVPWLGRIPAHWETAKMWRISRAVGGGTPSKEDSGYWEGDIPWVSPKDMKRRFIDSSEDTITERALAETGIKLIEPPMVLIVVRGMILAHTFPVAITTVPVTINQDMKALHLYGVEPAFMAWLFEGIGKSLLAAVVEEAAHGTRVIRMDQWRSVIAPVPPKREQLTISTYLDRETAKIDALIARVRQHIERMQELRTALISAAVTGQIDVREHTT